MIEAVMYERTRSFSRTIAQTHRTAKLGDPASPRKRNVHQEEEKQHNACSEIRPTIRKMSLAGSRQARRGVGGGTDARRVMRTAFHTTVFPPSQSYLWREKQPGAIHPAPLASPHQRHPSLRPQLVLLPASILTRATAPKRDNPSPPFQPALQHLTVLPMPPRRTATRMARLEVGAGQRRHADAVNETSALDGREARLFLPRAHAVVPLHERRRCFVHLVVFCMATRGVVPSSVPELGEHRCTKQHSQRPRASPASPFRRVPSSRHLHTTNRSPAPLACHSVQVLPTGTNHGPGRSCTDTPNTRQQAVHLPKPLQPCPLPQSTPPPHKMPTCSVSVRFRAGAVHLEAPGGWGVAPIHPKHTSAGATPLSPSIRAPPRSRHRNSTKRQHAPSLCVYTHVTPANRHQAAGRWLGVGGERTFRD